MHWTVLKCWQLKIFEHSVLYGQHIIISKLQCCPRMLVQPAPKSWYRCTALYQRAPIDCGSVRPWTAYITRDWGSYREGGGRRKPNRVRWGKTKKVLSDRSVSAVSARGKQILLTAHILLVFLTATTNKAKWPTPPPPTPTPLQQLPLFANWDKSAL